jgi:hypothetical protein
MTENGSVPTLDDLDVDDIRRASLDREPTSTAKKIASTARPAEEEKKRQVHVKLAPPELARIDWIKRNTRRSIQDLCEEWITDGIKRTIIEIDRKQNGGKGRK